ncbi:hypothetical protein Ciccas_013924 [Cichlidogyrus casuarinus]|uniref:Uncharacterized protein n=1 Tax=Cichlidogyrus casuarinus TaxID=1844966 RepID=A0ABD2PJE9_9PLAT
MDPKLKNLIHLRWFCCFYAPNILPSVDGQKMATDSKLKAYVTCPPPDYKLGTTKDLMRAIILLLALEDEGNWNTNKKIEWLRDAHKRLSNVYPSDSSQMKYIEKYYSNLAQKVRMRESFDDALQLLDKEAENAKSQALYSCCGRIFCGNNKEEVELKTLVEKLILVLALLELSQKDTTVLDPSPAPSLEGPEPEKGQSQT